MLYLCVPHRTNCLAHEYNLSFVRILERMRQDKTRSFVEVETISSYKKEGECLINRAQYVGAVDREDIVGVKSDLRLYKKVKSKITGERRWAINPDIVEILIRLKCQKLSKSPELAANLVVSKCPESARPESATDYFINPYTKTSGQKIKTVGGEVEARALRRMKDLNNPKKSKFATKQRSKPILISNEDAIRHHEVCLQISLKAIELFG
jgi:hypothetical protein